MTEAEWLTATDYLAMLIYLRGDITCPPADFQSGLHCGAGFLAYGAAERCSHRKLRLFAACLCKRWWTLPLDDISRQFLVTYERFTNENATWEEVMEAVRMFHQGTANEQRPVITGLISFWDDTPNGIASLGNNLAWTLANHIAKDSVALTCRNATEDDWFEWGWGIGPPDSLWQSTRSEVEASYPPLMRDIFGNPFRPVTLDPAWRAWNDGTVVKLAQAIYDERELPSGHLDAGRLAILADALEDAGCSNAEILGHCRTPGPHVRGCWVVDLLLGRE